MPVHSKVSRHGRQLRILSLVCVPQSTCEKRRRKKRKEKKHDHIAAGNPSHHHLWLVNLHCFVFIIPLIKNTKLGGLIFCLVGATHGSWLWAVHCLCQLVCLCFLCHLFCISFVPNVLCPVVCLFSVLTVLCQRFCLCSVPTVLCSVLTVLCANCSVSVLLSLLYANKSASVLCELFWICSMWTAPCLILLPVWFFSVLCKLLPASVLY